MSISLKLSELDTPSLLIDKAKLFENIDYCQRRAHELGVNWRPHVKTHKCAPIAAMQVQTRHSTWFRSAKYASLGDLLPDLFSDGEIDMEALEKFVEEGGETFQHLSAENRRMLEQMVEDWQLYEEAMDSVRDYRPPRTAPTLSTPWPTTWAARCAVWQRILSPRQS